MLLKALKLFQRAHIAAPESPGPQFGALPYAIRDGQLVVLLITSRGRGKWIFPKGGLMEGMTPHQSAAHEAWEEAGVTGEIEPTPLGSYFLPVTDERPEPIEVKMFPLLVTGQREDWQERYQRQRYWADLAEAQTLITHDGLAELALELARRKAALALQGGPLPAAIGR